MTLLKSIALVVVGGGKVGIKTNSLFIGGQCLMVPLKGFEGNWSEPIFALSWMSVLWSEDIIAEF